MEFVMGSVMGLVIGSVVGPWGKIGRGRGVGCKGGQGVCTLLGVEGWVGVGVEVRVGVWLGQ